MLTAPEMVATAATDVAGIRSAISMANAAAAAPVSGVLAAAGDEVSTAIARLFSAYGLEYQAVMEQAAAFHADFTAALAAAASAYAEAEAAGAALLSRASNGLGAVNAPIRTLLGSTPAGTGSSGALASMMKLAAVDPLTALIMGGTDNPLPDPAYVTAINNAYIQPRFPGAVPQGLFTPEQFWPITGTLTFGQSVAQGVTLLNSEIDHQINTLGNSVVVFGYSQSAAIATNEINALMAAGAPYTGQLSFVLASNPNNPDGVSSRGSRVSTSRSWTCRLPARRRRTAPTRPPCTQSSTRVSPTRRNTRCTSSRTSTPSWATSICTTRTNI
ncbi:PE family protein [Mycobacterium kansasii]|uniref:PE family protein n=1 Tax=Mycobacterium kansasii TaxID=1768 RepID=A0A1V3WXU4_MYCKA|nr:PE family protein [Mycobacterium kansasii]